MKTLFDIQPGENVIIKKPYKRGVVQPVKRVTAKRVYIATHGEYEMEFRKDTGAEIGGFESRSIEVATDEKIALLEIHRRYDKLYEMRLFVNANDHPMINEVYDFLNERKLIR